MVSYQELFDHATDDERQHVVRTIVDALDFLDQRGHDAFLAFGNLLGAVRDGRLTLIEGPGHDLPVTLRAVLGARIDGLGPDAREVARQILSGERRAPSSLRPEIPFEMDELVLRAPDGTLLVQPGLLARLVPPPRSEAEVAAERQRAGASAREQASLFAMLAWGGGAVLLLASLLGASWYFLRR